MAVIGIDLGGTKIAAALFDHSANMVCKEVKLLNGASGEQVGKLVTEIVSDILGKSSASDKVVGIGVCVPGIVYSKKGTVWAPNIPGWDNYPLLKQIQDALPDKSVKVCIESDRTCYILGEVWKGAAIGCDNAIYMAVGTGIGAGILIDGHVLHGASDIVGATGWMALQYPYSEDYIQCGCYEHFASGNGIAVQAKKALKCAQNYNYNGVLSKKPIEEVTSHDVFAAYESSDHIAVEVLDKAIAMWGMAAANLVSLFNPQKLIFGGGVFGPAGKFLPRIYNEACKWGQPIAMKEVEFCVSKIDGEAALIGAAYLAIRGTDSLKG